MAEYINRERARFEAKRYFKDLDEIQEDLDMLFCMLPAEDVAPVRHGKIIETIEDGHMKRTFSCCGTDFTQLTCWMTPKYCPNCGARINE